MENQIDFCKTCQRVVPGGTEHDYWKHGSTKESADELADWRRRLHESGAHHTTE